MKNKKSLILASILIVLVTFTLLFFFFWYGSSKSSKISGKPIDLTTHALEPTDIPLSFFDKYPEKSFNPPITKSLSFPKKEDIKDWSLYHWSGSLYQFYYPSDWRLFKENPANQCASCQEQLTLSRGQSYPSDGSGEIVIYIENFGANDNNLSGFENARIEYTNNIKHEMVNGKLAATFNWNNDNRISGISLPNTIKSYLFYHRGYGYYFSLNDTSKVRADLTNNLDTFEKIISTITFKDPHKDWVQESTPFFTFRRPPEWKIASAQDLSVNNKFSTQCSGIVFKNEENEFIALEILDLSDKRKYCWDIGDFSTLHSKDPADTQYVVPLKDKTIKRSIGVFQVPIYVDVVLWKPTRDETWQGDLFQSAGFTLKKANKKFAIALISKNKSDRLTRRVFDLVLSTITISDQFR